MVQLNFTLIIEMGLFLVFLWVTKCFIFRPLLEVMDAREAKLLDDRSTVEAETTTAQTLETAHAESQARAKLAASLRIRKERHDATAVSHENLRKLRADKDAEVAVFRDSLMERLEVERRRYPELIPNLTETMDRWVRSEEAGQ
jgi:F-type H+-transporting ATPase subunit b